MLRNATLALSLLGATVAQAQDARRASTGRTTGSATQSTGTATGLPATSGAIAVNSNQGVSLARALFYEADHTLRDTAQGVLMVDAQKLARSTGMYQGYLQVVTNAGPVLYDVPFDANPAGRMPARLQALGVRAGGPAHVLQVPFNLGTAEPVSVLPAQVVLTAEPLRYAERFDAVMNDQPVSTWSVLPLQVAIGGDGVEGTYLPVMPPADPGLPPAPQDPKFEVPEGPEEMHILPWALNVETARNQCVPSAHANTLAFLDKVYAPHGVDFPQQNHKGVAIDGDETSFVSRTEWYMDRTHTDTCNGNGTGRCGGSSHIRGIFEFLSAFDPQQNLEVSHQGGAAVYPGTCEQYIDRESQREGAAVTFDWLCDRVQDGAGIVISFGFYSFTDGEWDRTGGHAVRVYGCGVSGGRRFIRTVDDGFQDGMVDTNADNVPDQCAENGGLRTQHWWLDQGYIEGRLPLSNSARQVEFAVAYTPDI